MAKEFIHVDHISLGRRKRNPKAHIPIMFRSESRGSKIENRVVFLSDEQLRFINEYVATKNLKEACANVGIDYKVGWGLLRSTIIIDVIALLREQSAKSNGLTMEYIDAVLFDAIKDPTLTADDRAKLIPLAYARAGWLGKGHYKDNLTYKDAGRRGNYRQDGKGRPVGKEADLVGDIVGAEEGGDSPTGEGVDEIVSDAKTDGGITVEE